VFTFLEFQRLGMDSFIRLVTSRWKWSQCAIRKGYPYAWLKGRDGYMKLLGKPRGHNSMIRKNQKCTWLEFEIHKQSKVI
jgi:hypothetical protein